MDAGNLIELEMSTRVVAFSKANPSDNPGQEAAVAKLDEKVAKAKALVNRGDTGHLTVRASVLTKDEVREALTVKIRLLQGVARAAAVEVPGVGARIRLRGGRPGNTAFLASAQLALAQATEFQELFTKYGMPPGFLEEFGSLLRQFEASLDEKNLGLRTHVGANAELEATMSDIMMLVKQLDAINRHRFRKDPERLAAWKSARNVHWPDGPKAAKAAKDGKSGSEGAA
jgi:hypothetical protein